MKGILITLEGIEGAGKSLICKGLLSDINSLGLDVVVSREPGGTPLAEEIRKVLLWGQSDTEVMHPDTELLLVYASRAQHYQTLVKPALDRQAICLLDRFQDSAFAMQGHGSGMPEDRISTINDFVLGGFKPDLTLLFDLPVSVGASRIKSREKLDFFEKKGPEFHERVRAGYLEMAKREPGRFRLIDASQSEECVREQVRAIIPEILRLHLAD